MKVERIFNDSSNLTLEDIVISLFSKEIELLISEECQNEIENTTSEKGKI